MRPGRSGDLVQVGSAVVTVSNSTLVGQGAVLQSRGATVLFGQNSVLHGKKSITGAFAFIDLGGNTWE